MITFLDFRYESGDHVAVFPTNDSALVNKLGQILGVDLDVVISLNNLDGGTLKYLDFNNLFNFTNSCLDIYPDAIGACVAHEVVDD